MAGLIVSVRSRSEIGRAIAGGASILDVKEPRLGSLGRATDRLIEFAVAQSGRVIPVSAAMGELNASPKFPPRGLAYAKWGLSGYKDRDWHNRLSKLRREMASRDQTCIPVVVGYADWERAQSPDPALLCDFACANCFPVMLVDTWGKDGTTLLDWMSLAETSKLAERCRLAGVKLALAGSLGKQEIRLLSVLRPEWFAVRGAVCRRGVRGGTIDAALVSAIVQVCRSTKPFPAMGER